MPFYYDQETGQYRHYKGRFRDTDPPVEYRFPTNRGGPLGSGRGNRDGLRVRLDALTGLTYAHGALATPFMFQCPPLEEFTTEYSHSHTDYETVAKGQYSRPGGVQLRTVSFDTLFVDYGSYTVNDFTDERSTIEHFTDDLIRICEAGTPFMLTVAHELPPGDWDHALAAVQPEVQMPATLRSLRVTERAGEGDARYVNVNFVEYRDPVVDRDRLGQRRAGERTFPRHITFYPISDAAITDKGNYMQAGPNKGAKLTLFVLSSVFYGHGEGAAQIARTNDLGNWGYHTPLKDHPKLRGKKQVRLTIDRLGTASKVRPGERGLKVRGASK